MAGMPWVKVYVDILDDIKVAELEESQKWRFVQLILLAAECDADGALVTGDSPMSHKQIAWRLRCDAQTVQNDIKKMLGIGLLESDDDILVVSKFSERQGPTQAEKRKQWRDRQQKRRERAKKKKPVTGESPVTPTGVTLKEEEEELKNREEGVGKKRQRDPFLDHPAIIAYKEEARLNVPINWRQQVADTVTDPVGWQRLVHDWIGRGWNKQNISGMLDAYRSGGINKNRNGRASAASNEPTGTDIPAGYTKEQVRAMKGKQK